MSKNELVSYIHALTGKSYKDARAICKATKWNASKAVVYAATKGKAIVLNQTYSYAMPDILAAIEGKDGNK